LCAGVLPFLVLVSVSIDDGIAPLILQLLQCALCGSKALEQATHSSAAAGASSSTSSSIGGSASSPAKPKSSKEKKDDKSEGKGAYGSARKKECELF